MRTWRLLAIVLAALACASWADAPERRNWFGDPFFQITSGFADCPVPRGPLLTQEEQRREAHDRIERGTGCWLEGRCADSNVYRGDQALGAKVKTALAAMTGIADTSVWVTVQRHWVFLQGCVAAPQQAERLEQAVKSIEGVELVVPALDMSIGRPPRYPLATQ